MSAHVVNSRAVNPFDPVLISFATVQGGTNFNVLPGTVVLKGTVRTFSQSARQRTNDLLTDIAGQIAARYRGSAEVRTIRGYDPLVNHPEAVRVGAVAASALFGAGSVDAETEPVMFGEDFCYYTQKVPGALFMIGAGVDGTRCPLHNSRVVFDEEVLWRSSAFLATVAIGYGRV
jgi:metal-dependent amidase/aminoacylase/carboxypeptidase family protein